LWEKQKWFPGQRVTWHVFLNAFRDFFTIRDGVDLGFLKHCVGGTSAESIPSQGIGVSEFNLIFNHLGEVTTLDASGIHSIYDALFQHSWFCGWSEDKYIQQELAEKDVGSFLVRYSKQNSSFSLVVKMSPHASKEQFSKYLIEQKTVPADPNTDSKAKLMYTLSWSKAKFPFDSLGELLNHFYSHHLPHSTLHVVLKPTTISFGDLAYE